MKVKPITFFMMDINKIFLIICLKDTLGDLGCPITDHRSPNFELGGMLSSDKLSKHFNFSSPAFLNRYC